MSTALFSAIQRDRVLGVLIQLHSHRIKWLSTRNPVESDKVTRVAVDDLWALYAEYERLTIELGKYAHDQDREQEAAEGRGDPAAPPLGAGEDHDATGTVVAEGLQKTRIVDARGGRNAGERGA